MEGAELTPLHRSPSTDSLRSQSSTYTNDSATSSIASTDLPPTLALKSQREVFSTSLKEIGTHYAQPFVKEEEEGGGHFLAKCCIGVLTLPFNLLSGTLQLAALACDATSAGLTTGANTLGLLADKAHNPLAKGLLKTMFLVPALINLPFKAVNILLKGATIVLDFSQTLSSKSQLQQAEWHRSVGDAMTTLAHLKGAIGDKAITGKDVLDHVNHYKTVQMLTQDFDITAASGEGDLSNFDYACQSFAKLTKDEVGSDHQLSKYQMLADATLKSVQDGKTDVLLQNVKKEESQNTLTAFITGDEFKEHQMRFLDTASDIIQQNRDNTIITNFIENAVRAIVDKDQVQNLLTQVHNETNAATLKTILNRDNLQTHKPTFLQHALQMTPPCQPFINTIISDIENEDTIENIVRSIDNNPETLTALVEALRLPENNDIKETYFTYADTLSDPLRALRERCTSQN